MWEANGWGSAGLGENMQRLSESFPCTVELVSSLLYWGFLALRKRWGCARSSNRQILASMIQCTRNGSSRGPIFGQLACLGLLSHQVN